MVTGFGAGANGALPFLGVATSTGTFSTGLEGFLVSAAAFGTACGLTFDVGVAEVCLATAAFEAADFEEFVVSLPTF